MTHYDEKEAHVLMDVAAAINNLDKTLDEINQLDSKAKSNYIKKWYAEKKATHEIKRILHEANLYEKYEDDEMQQFADFLDSDVL